mgnify:CR=1 FL=1
MASCARVALLAVGTRGDVQPLLELAIALRSSRPHSVVTLITHAAHPVGPHLCLSAGALQKQRCWCAAVVVSKPALPRASSPSCSAGVGADARRGSRRGSEPAVRAACACVGDVDTRGAHARKSHLGCCYHLTHVCLGRTHVVLCAFTPLPLPKLSLRVRFAGWQTQAAIPRGLQRQQ